MLRKDVNRFQILVKNVLGTTHNKTKSNPQVSDHCLCVDGMSDSNVSFFLPFIVTQWRWIHCSLSYRVMLPIPFVSTAYSDLKLKYYPVAEFQSILKFEN